MVTPLPYYDTIFSEQKSYPVVQLIYYRTNLSAKCTGSSLDVNGLTFLESNLHFEMALEHLKIQTRTVKSMVLSRRTIY